MVADEEGAPGVRRGGLFTSDDFLTCEGLSGGGVAAAGARSGGFAGPTSGAFRTCEGLSGEGAAAAGEGTAGVRRGDSPCRHPVLSLRRTVGEGAAAAGEGTAGMLGIWCL